MLKPLKAILWVALLLLFAGPVFAQSVDTAWVRAYNGPANGPDEAQAMAVDDSGNVYVTGSSAGSGGYRDYVTVKYLPDGDTAWVRRYDGPANGEDYAEAMAIDDSGFVYVTGYSDGVGTFQDYATIKYDSSGTEIWVKRYDYGVTGTDKSYAIAADDSSNVYVTGVSGGGATSFDYATIKYHSTGDTAWVRRYNAPGNGSDYARAVAVDDSGNVYVTGDTRGGGTGADIMTIRYYPTGDTAWVRKYNGFANLDDFPKDIAVDDSGNVYVAGCVDMTDKGAAGSAIELGDYCTIKYYPNGDTAWLRRYNGPGNDYDWARAMAVDNSGFVYVTGESKGTGTHHDYATIKYLPDGDTAWVRRYNGPGNSLDAGLDIVADGSGNIYVTGLSTGSGTGYDYATVKYLADGDSGWVMRYNGPGNGSDRAVAVVADDSGNVYVTGYSDGDGTSSDYCTIKYVQGISLVSIVDFAFVPQDDTVFAGESVRWTNNGAVPHTSTSDSKSLWDSGTLNPGESFAYRFDSPGSYPYHCEFHPGMTGTIVVQPSTDVKDETGSRERPSEFDLSQNYPNPFNPTTKIEFTLAKSGFVTLQIYDTLGRKVRTLVSEELSSGYKSVVWDGKNDDAKDVASGVYFYQLRVGDFSQPKKMLLLK